MIKTTKEVADELLAELDKPRMNTGLAALDEVMQSIRESSVYVIAGHRSSGRSSLAMHIAAHVVNQSFGVLYFELDSGIQALENRLDVSQAVPPEKVICCSEPNRSSIRVEDLVGAVAAASQERKPNLVVVDSLAMLAEQSRKTDESRADCVMRVLRELNFAAKRLGVAFLVTQKTKDGRGFISERYLVWESLESANAFDLYADCVLFLHRPNYYNETAGKRSNLPGEDVLVSVEKNRHGPLGTVRLMFDAKRHTWTSPEGSAR